MSNDYDAAVAASMQPNLAQSARIGFSVAADTNPDAYAEAQRVARRTGVPVDTVLAMPTEMKRQDAIGSIDFDSLAKTSPATAALLSDVEKSKVAHDAIDGLTKAEELIYNLGKFGAGTAKAVTSSVPKLNEGAWGVARAGADLLPDFVGKPMADYFARMGGVSRNTADALVPKSESLLGASWYSGMQSLGLNVILLPLTLASGGTAAPVLAGMGLTQAGQSYGEARDKGVGVMPSLGFAASQGVIEAGTEMIGMPALLSILKPGKMSTKAIEYLWKDQLGEQAATHLQDLNEWAVINPEKTFADYWNERLSAALQTALSTAFSGGGQVAVMKGLEVFARRNDLRVQQAESAADQLARLNQLAAADKVLQRDPQTFEAFVAQAAENGPVRQIFIDGKTLMQSGVAEQLAAVSPAVATQLAEAVQTGGQIAIPVEEYAARIAPTEYAQSLVDHVRTEPDGFSRAEAQKYMQSHADDLRSEVEKVLSEEQGNDAFKQSAEAVKANIKQQLDTAARFTPQVNEAYSAMVGSFYAVQAARAGVTPEAMFERYPLKVDAERVDGQQFEQSDYRATGTTPEDFIEHRGSINLGDISQEISRAIKRQSGGIRLNVGMQNADGTGFGLAHIEARHGKAIRAAGFASVEHFIHEAIRHVDAVWQPGSTSQLVAVESGHKGKVMFLELQAARDEGGDYYRVNSAFPADEKYIARKQRKEGWKSLWSRYPVSAEASGATGFADGAPIAGEPAPTVSPQGEAPSLGQRDLSGKHYRQDARGSFNPASLSISLLKGADLSTFLHESGHFFLEVMADMASRPDAPDQVRQDIAALLSWFGVKSIDEWQSLDFDGKRAYHERFARGFETYLFEGKAPSIELQGLFQRFRAWLINVYRELKTLNVELNDQVRSVFDRMLATTEQIQLAEHGRSMMPLFERADQAGMTPDDFAAYQALGVDATNEAIEELQARGLRDMQWLHNTRGRIIKQLQKESSEQRAEAKADVRREVMSRPVYQAWQFLTGKEVDGGESVGKLSRTALADMYGGHDGAKTDKYALLDWKRITDLRMTAEEGEHPDMVAERFGFSSGDELVRRLLSAEKPDVEIEALTDARMLEQYGNLSSQQEIERAADEAIHNDVRARMVATEANALAQAAGKPKILSSAAKEFAAAMIARLKVRAIQPAQYANAEVRASKAAAKASKAGDLETAGAEKRNQLINNYATRAAYDALDEIDKGLRYLKKFEGDIKGLDADYADQIANLLERFDLRRKSNKAVDRAQNLRMWVQAQLNAGEIPDIAETLLSPSERAAYRAQVESRDADGELVYADDEERIKLLADAIDRSAKRSYKDITVEEFRGLVDTVRQIEHFGQLKHQLLTARSNADYAAVRDEIAAGIVAQASADGKNTRTANDWLGQKLQAIKQFGAAHIKVATWARIMDGGQDNGPVWRYLVQPANERASRETSMRADVTAKLDAIMRPVLAKVSAGDKSGSGKFFPSIGESLNWQERFAIALNVGNESNLQRLLGGRGWTMAQIKPVLNTLTAEEWSAAQAVGDLFESLRPLIAEKELRVTGKEPEWIKARPISVQTADGQAIALRGWYYPVVFDPRVNMKAAQHASAEEAKNAMKAAYSAATTRRSFVKSRVEEVTGRPLLLNLQGIYSGFNDVIHDLAWHEWLIDANKLLRSHTIDQAMREHYGPEVKREFEKWRDDIVAGNRRLDHGIERAAAFLRQHISASALTFNVMSAAMQPLGLANSVARIGATWVGKGIARYISAPIEATRDAQEKSEWLRNRTRTRFRELNELRNQIQGQTAARELMGRYGYWLMMRSQLMVDVPTWWGGYEKAIAGGHDERTAINLADQAVKDAQGGGEEVDQSGIERGGPLVKLFTAFYGFMGTTLNTAYLDARTENSKANLAADMMLVLAVPAVLGSLLRDALTPGDSDDDGLVKKLIAEQLSFLIGLIAFGREFSSIAKVVTGDAKGATYTGPAGLRVIGDSLNLARQSAQGEFDDAFRKAFVTTLGDVTGIPAVQINRTITGAQALAEGKTQNPGAIAFGFQGKR